MKGAVVVSVLLLSCLVLVGFTNYKLPGRNSDQYNAEESFEEDNSDLLERSEPMFEDNFQAHKMALIRYGELYGQGEADGIDVRDKLPIPPINVTVNYTIVELKFSGAVVCTNFTCGNGSFPATSYQCNTANPDEAFQNHFNDPIPLGYQLLGINLTLTGRFFCVDAPDEVYFLTMLNDIYLALGRLPNTLKHCNCDHCVIPANYVADQNVDDFKKAYRYLGTNNLQVMTLSPICLSTVNLTLFYIPIEFTVVSVTPAKGPTEGGTLVLISFSGRGYDNNTAFFCKFGNGKPTQADYVDENTVNCTTTPVQAAGSFKSS